MNPLDTAVPPAPAVVRFSDDVVDALNVQPDIYPQVILGALNASGRHVYAGTVTTKVKAHRRAVNKRARASRARNR